LAFAPESPYWLIRQNRREDARRAIVQLSSSSNPPDVDAVLLGIEQTDRLEREYEESTTYWDLLKGANAVRTEITVMVYLIQVIGGNPLIAFATFFFEQAGLSTKNAFNSESCSQYVVW
jgi:MFS transporter, SP family, general alpha glucoside:H+ symporter